MDKTRPPVPTLSAEKILSLLDNLGLNEKKCLDMSLMRHYIAELIIIVIIIIIIIIIIM